MQKMYLTKDTALIKMQATTYDLLYDTDFASVDNVQHMLFVEQYDEMEDVIACSEYVIYVCNNNTYKYMGNGTLQTCTYAQAMQMLHTLID